MRRRSLPLVPRCDGLSLISRREPRIQWQPFLAQIPHLKMTVADDGAPLAESPRQRVQPMIVGPAGNPVNSVANSLRRRSQEVSDGALQESGRWQWPSKYLSR